MKAKLFSTLLLLLCFTLHPHAQKQLVPTQWASDKGITKRQNGLRPDQQQPQNPNQSPGQQIPTGELARVMTLLQQGEWMAQEGKTTEALAFFNQALEEVRGKPKFVEMEIRLLEALGETYFQAGNPAQAKASYQQALLRAKAAGRIENFIADYSNLERISQDFPSNAAQPRLIVQNGHTNEVYSVAFSPDGRTLATGGYDKLVKLWDAATKAELRTLRGHTGYVSSVAFSPDGRTLASGSYDSTIRLWDVATGAVLRTFSLRRLPMHKKEVYSVAFSRDGRMLASGNSDQTVGLWEVATGAELRSLERVESAWSISFSPDGRTLATGNQLWEVATGAALRTLRGHNNVRSVAFAPDGRTLATGSWDGTAKLWEVATGAELRTLRGHRHSINSVAFSPDGRTLATGSNDNTVKLWQVATGAELHALTASTGAVTSVAFSPDGRTLATGSNDKTVKLWQVATGNLLDTLRGHRYLIESVAFLPDGLTLATKSADLLIGDNTVKLWEAAAGVKLRTLSGHMSQVNSAVFAPDGRTLATGGSDSTVRLWDVATGAELRTLPGGAFTPAAFSPDSRILATGSYDNNVGLQTVKLWEVATGAELRSLRTGQVEYAQSIAFSPDGRTLAAGIADNTVRLWEVATGAELRTLRLPDAVMGAMLRPHTGDRTIEIAFSPDSRTLATADVFSIRLWEVQSGRELPLPYPMPAWFLAHRLLNNGKNILLSSHDGQVNFIKFDTGEKVCSLIALGASDWVVVAPDGRFDASRLEDIKGLNWVTADEPMRALPLEIFMRDYYEPGLLARLLSGEALKPVRKLQSLNRAQPRISNLNASAPDATGIVTVTLEVASQTSQQQRDASGKLMVSGVYDVRLFRDEQLVGSTTTVDAGTDATDEKALAAWRTANEVKLVNGKKMLSFRVALPQMEGKQTVEFSAYAFNADRVKSETVRTEYKLPATLAAKPKRAYVVTFGVNRNDNVQWNLNYAANDARRLATDVSARLQATGEFAEVVTVPLISDDESVNGQTRNRREATKANLKAVMDLLAGKPASAGHALTNAQLSQLKKATPNDVVLFAFASHGYSNNNGVFYLVPQDTGQATGSGLAGVLERCISSDELSQWLREVDAGEMVMIVDACHSAAAVQGQSFKPGPMGSRGLGQLAYDKRIRLLAATQANNVALELNRLQHGLLTAALLEDGLKSFLADHQPKDEKIELGEWLSYGVARAPQLYNDIRAGRRTLLENGRTVDRARSSILVGGERQAASTQQPTLFDFARNHRDVFLHLSRPAR